MMSQRPYLAVLGIGFFIIYSIVATSYAHATDAKAKLQKAQELIVQQREHAAELERKTQEAETALSALRTQLITVTHGIQEGEAKEDELQDHLDHLDQAIQAEQAVLTKHRVNLQHSLTAMLTLSRFPPELLFLQPGAVAGARHQGLYLKGLSEELRAAGEAAAKSVEELQALQVDQQAQQNAIAETRQKLEAEQQNLTFLIKQRQGLQQQSESERQKTIDQVSLLSQQVHDLQELLQKVTPRRKSKGSVNTGDKILLTQPVSGKIIRPYGLVDQDGVRNQGVVFLSLSGAPVVAPKDGTVVFSGVFRRYGKVVILQHDNGYHSFISGFGRIDVDIGQDVNAGEPLGIMPLSTGARPELYLEWRHQTQPVEPSFG